MPLVLADHAFNRDGSFRYEENVDLGFRGDTLLVNGAVSPRMRVERRIYRLRFLNASNARSYDLRSARAARCCRSPATAACSSAPSRARASPCTRRSGSRSWSTSGASGPGRRSCSRTPAATRPTTRNVMRFDVVGGGGGEEARMPTGRMRTLEKLPEPNASRRWDLSLATASGVQWQIAERGFDPARIDVRPRLGTTELWQWHNPSNRVHPMHLHGMLFRIVERSTGVIHPGERGWKDTIGVLPGETATVQPWFAPVRRPLRLPLPRPRARRTRR